MVDYRVKVSRSPAKRLALHLLSLRPVNALVVGALRALPRGDFRRRVPALGAVGEIDVGSGRIVMSDAARCSIARDLFWGRGNFASGAERETLNVAVRLSGSASLFVDIGAYTGLFALVVARANPHITSRAYEIVPENFVLMCQNVIANDLVGRVQPHLLGIGSEESFIRVPASFGIGVLASSVALGSDAPDGVRIPVLPLDSTLDGSERIVAKIDVEGFEGAVLEGARETIARTRPDIICEILRKAPTSEIDALLRPVGYRFYRITESGLSEGPLVPVKTERDWLFTCRTAAELRNAGLHVLSA